METMPGTFESRINPAHVFNVPNQLSFLRLILAIALFFIMTWQWYMASLVVFILAAATDWIDGYWARKYGQVTTLGRILDPFVDKVVICGTFIFLVAEPRSGVAAWMATVIVGRELLVTALRGFIEQQGGDFSASMAGKLKMVFQCIAAALCIFVLSYTEPQVVPTALAWTRTAMVWLAVLLTIYSGVGYIFVAIRLLTAPDSRSS